MTTRGLVESDFKQVAVFLDRCIKIAIDIQNDKGKMLKDFLLNIENNNDIIETRNDVISFSNNFEFYL